MSMIQDPQALNSWIIFGNQSGNVIPSEVSPWQSTVGLNQENLMTPSNLSNSIKPQINATGMDARDIVVLEDPLDPNSIQHQTEIVQNVAYSEDVETIPDCELTKKPSELCVVPPPNKSPRLNTLGRSFLVQTLSNRQPAFSTQTSNVTSTTPVSVSKTSTGQWLVEKESKAASFPSNLSAKNVKINSGENLTRDTVYLLKGADGIHFTAVWNGQQFEQFPDQSTVLTTVNSNNASSSVQHMTGGGGGNTQTTRNSVLQGGLPVMNPRTPPHQEKIHIYRTTQRRPLNKVDEDQPKSELNNSTTQITKVNIASSLQNSSSVSSSNNDSSKKEALPTKKLITTKEDIVMMLCLNCGNTSRNLQRCDRCKKKIPENAKIIKYSPLKKELITIKKTDSNFKLEKRQFYSKNIAEQVSAFTSPESLSKTTTLVCSTDLVKPNQYSRSRLIARNRKSSTLHSIKPHVPETVTISDDDEPPPPPPPESSEGQSKPSDSSMQTSLNNSSSSTCTVANTSKSDLPDDDDDRCDSPIFPAISTNLSLANKSRCNRMEDELGNVVSRVGQQQMEVDDPDDGFPPQGDNPDPAFIPDRVLFHTRHLRIGTVDINSSREIVLTKDSLSFEFTEDNINFKIFPVEFKSCECSFVYHWPVIFLHLAPSCGGRIRAVLNITHDSKPYFDPDSTDPTQRYIVMLLEPSKKMVSVRKATCEIFQSYQKIQSQTRGQDQEIYREILPEEANKRLTEICPQIQLMSFPSSPESPYPSSPLDGGMALYQDTSSPPHMGFSGPVENLITYPPPPAKGGITITNEDFYCLNEGEFLNDVIIDFFLKYLVLEKLTEIDRQRTHVFSSFFYKRLTQRLNRHSYNTEQALESSPMIKRHAQVKTWTRHVDIFEKDFIIVPINENAHWFLAIICFPGMERPQSVRYLFVSNQDASNSPVQKLLNQAETVSSSNDTNKNATSPEIQKTHIKLSDLKKDAYTEIYGFKQPCILIFDSLAGPSRTNVVKTLREYLQVEWDTRKKMPKRVFDKDFIKGGVPKVPQQNNYSDCGVYVLQYVESFFKNPIKDFTIPIRKQNWFSEEHINSKRQEIQELIWNLKKEMDEKNASKNKS